VPDEHREVHQIRARHQLRELERFDEVVVAQPRAAFDDGAPDRRLLAAAERDGGDRRERARDVQQRRARRAS
jgi:hypothetical protein